MSKKLEASTLRWNFKDFNIIKKVLEEKYHKKNSKFTHILQKHTVSALELGFEINNKGFNIFVSGESGTGRTSTVKEILNKKAVKELTPNDIVLLYNFENKERPIAVSIPSSSGVKLKKTYDTLIDKTLSKLEKALNDKNHIFTKQKIQDYHYQKINKILKSIEINAKNKKFILSRSSDFLTLAPVGIDGTAITDNEFEKLTNQNKEKLKIKYKILENLLHDALSIIRIMEKKYDDDIEKLERKIANKVVLPLFNIAKLEWKKSKRILVHLEMIQNDIINRIRKLIPNKVIESTDHSENNNEKFLFHKRIKDEEEFDNDEPLLIRYKVNVLISNIKKSGAPVIQETYPTFSNLIGSIEQKLRSGETITDFTKIKAGTLLKANGGYLILKAKDLLSDLVAWEGLKKALTNQYIELDDPSEQVRIISVISIRPEPIHLSLKVILIGTPNIYYSLLKSDPEFVELFKIKADFNVEMDRSEEQILKYLYFLVDLCKNEKLRKLTFDGAARIIEHAAKLTNHQKKLTTKFGDIADLLRESNFWAYKKKDNLITAYHVKKALKEKSAREGLIETNIIDDILTGRITIETSGKVVGQCNALTVMELGSYEFGIPIRITCRIGCGYGELIDIERETELGGPIHTKGTMIIKGLLADRFGQDIALGFSATICMEQTYSEVDGDSASLAEACALFSMLANTPILQHFAITGSIDQRGIVQAVGGINEKIEGFFNICSKRNLEKCPGVILPEVNSINIMLNEDIVEACKNGSFAIYTVSTFEEAIELLTDKSWNKGKNSLRNNIFKTLKHLQLLRINEKKHFN